MMKQGEDEGEDEDLGENGIEDMVNMLKLTERNLLRNIQLRFIKHLIYTYSGSILVAVNPYKMFNIYGLDTVKEYEGKLLGARPPHLFAIGSGAVIKMTNDVQNQVVVISGESGAGKTESTKLLMQYLAAASSPSTSNLITERILEANPLLEAFGNAKTIRNDNSSRFGKYVELFFRGNDIVGAKTTHYLLEKSRIVTQAPEERNYHMFYEMLIGLTEEEKNKYGLGSAKDYAFLNYGVGSVVPSKNEVEDFRELKLALDMLAFTAEEQDTIFKILAAVLKLGNLAFSKVPNTFQNEGVQLSDPEALKSICRLLDLSKSGLTEALTTKVTEARQERLLTPLSTDQALHIRDAIAKALYRSLFNWLVKKINALVECDNRRRDLTSIAILDIFGFENFEDNSLEQLCINFANESLQYYFNEHVFTIEQAEYEKEGVRWTTVEFRDNQPVAELFTERPHGILHLLDDESNFPNGTDKSFLEKCHHCHASNSVYSKPRMSGLEFSVRHYAGMVKYNVRNFLDKNRDTLRTDLIQLLIGSRNPLISTMFQELFDGIVGRTLLKTTGVYAGAKPRTSTVVISFNESLQKLMDTMSKCNPWFVRCIKPNERKAAMVFELNVVQCQLLYTGMLETIKIRKMGYPVRYLFESFLRRYLCLLRTRPEIYEQVDGGDRKALCEALLNSLPASWIRDWQIGNTKLFLKESLSNYLDDEVSQVVRDAVVTIQKHIRGYLTRQHIQRKRNATLLLQAVLRRWTAVKRYQAERRMIIRAQAVVRTFLMKKIFGKMKDDYLSRRELEELRLKEQRRQQEEQRKELIAREREKRMRDGEQERGNKRPHQNGIASPDASAQPVVSVNNLEITAELAYVFDKLDHWHQIHADTDVKKAENIAARHHLNLQLPIDINSFVLSKFARVYCKDTFSVIKSSPIEAPFLLDLSDKDHRQSLALFQLLLRYLYDNNLNNTKLRIVGNYIIQTGLSGSESLRDEIYLQIMNQTFDNKDVRGQQRAWQLMSGCISTFQPSSLLSKYLLKYVSDHAYNGYKLFCQHKFLECIDLDSRLCRVYPPCLLEWTATSSMCSMGLNAVFSDGLKMCGQIESWNTAEEFASYLLQSRGVNGSGIHGWTVALLETNACFESPGYGFVLDLISELEVPPNFPFCNSYLLVSYDKSDRTTASVFQQRYNKDSPHSLDRVRNVDVVIPEPLTAPVVQPARPALAPENFFQYSDNTRSRDSELSSGLPLSPHSALNRRDMLSVDPTNILSKTSILNVRYIKNSNTTGISGPVLHNGNVGRSDNNYIFRAPSQKNRTNNGGGDVRYSSSGILVTPRAASNNNKVDMALNNKLNARYASAENIGNSRGDRYTTDVSQLDPNSKLYKRKSDQIPSPSAPQAVANRNGGLNNVSALNPQNGGVNGVDDGRSGVSDMDRWLETVFEQALDGTVDDLQDERAVTRKILGGGDKVQQEQSNSSLVTGGQQYSFGQAVYRTPAPLSSSSATTVLNVGPARRLSGPTSGSIPLGQFHIQSSSSIQQQLLQQQQLRQNSLLQSQLDQQHLQNDLLQERLQGELLRQQLQQVKSNNSNDLSRDQMLRLPSSAVHTTIVDVNGHTSGLPTSGILVNGAQNGPDSEIRTKSGAFDANNRTFVTVGRPDTDTSVSTHLVGGSATNQPINNSQFVPSSSSSTATGLYTSHISSNQIVAGNVAQILSNFSSNHNSTPDAVVSSHMTHVSKDNFAPPSTVHNQVSYSAESTSAVYNSSSTPSASAISIPSIFVPNAPPPPPIPKSIRNLPPGITPVTIRDRNGVQRRVRVGRIEWPPPQEPEVKPEVEVGRLLIHEYKAEDGQVVKKKSTEAVRQKISERILAAQRQAAASTREMELVPERGASAPDKIRPQPMKKSFVARAEPVKPRQEEVIRVDVVRQPSDRLSVTEQQAVRDDMRRRRERLQDQLNTLNRTSNAVIVPERLTRYEDAAGVAVRGQTTPDGPGITVDNQRTRESRADVPAPKALVNSTSFVTKSATTHPGPTTASSVNNGLTPQRPQSSSTNKDRIFDLRSLEPIQTVLLKPSSTSSASTSDKFITYDDSRVDWRIVLRKELFTPMERLDNQLLIQLIFNQIVSDVNNSRGLQRIRAEDKTRMKALLEGRKQNQNRVSDEDTMLKLSVIEQAKQWPLYFSRLFPIRAGKNDPSVQLLAVSHSGLRLVNRQRDGNDERFSVKEHIRLEEIQDVSVPKVNALQIHHANKYTFLYTSRANQIKGLVEAFCIECEQDARYVRATKSYVTRDRKLLSFQQGDIIKLTNKDMLLEKGWLYGAVNGNAGMFPSELIAPLAIHEVDEHVQQLSTGSNNASFGGRLDSPSGSGTLQRSMAEAGSKYCMLEFAMLHFREATYRSNDTPRSDSTTSTRETFASQKLSQDRNHSRGGLDDWTWKEQVNMIKWTKSPIAASLLKFESRVLNKMAAQSFIDIMQYMGDYPLQRGTTPADSALRLLSMCHNQPEICDEVFCQLIKQTTNNHSTKIESCQLGWRLLLIVTSYFRCSDVLLPYLQKYLEQTAYDNTRANYSLEETCLFSYFSDTYSRYSINKFFPFILELEVVAALCLHNVRQTFKYGGRRNMPTAAELDAIYRGRSAKQIVVMLPGGIPVRITVRSSSVIADAIAQICDALEIFQSLERTEFIVYAIITREDCYFSLRDDIYVMDVISDLDLQGKEFYFLCQRMSWAFPVHLDGAPLYISLMYQQMRPDYIDGYLLALPSKTLNNQTQDEIAILAALQIRVAELPSFPTLKQMDIYIPRNAHHVANMNLSKWSSKVESFMPNVRHMSPLECQMKFLEILSQWPKCGSTFFAIKDVSESKIHGECLLAINKDGVHLCSSKTYETLLFIPFRELLSARQRSDPKRLAHYLDLRCGNLMQHAVIELETDQADEIGSLIDRYIKIHKALKEGSAISTSHSFRY